MAVGGDSCQAGLPSPETWWGGLPTGPAGRPEPTAERPRLPPEAQSGHSVDMHRAKVDVAKGVPASSPHTHTWGWALGVSRFLEDPVCTQPISTSLASLPLLWEGASIYHVHKNVALGTHAMTPSQFAEQFLPKLPLEQDGTA